MSYYILGQTLPLKYSHLIIVLEGTKQSLYYFFFLHKMNHPLGWYCSDALQT